MIYKICALATLSDDNSLKDFLKAHGLFSKVALAKRMPVAQLGVLNGEPYLSISSPQDLMDAVYAGAEVRAVSCAPANELRRLNHSFFIFGQRFLEIVYTPDAPEPEVKKAYVRDPAHRFRTVVLRVGTPNRDFYPIQEMPAVGVPALIVNPQLFELEEAAANSLYSVLLRTAPPGLFLLPPTVGEADEDSYFSETEAGQPRQEVREELQRLAATSMHEPALVSLWKLADEPLLRDYLSEGASLEIPTKSGGPTTCELWLPPGNEAIERYRQAFLLNHQQLAGPDWLGDLAKAYRDDLESLLPERINLKVGSQKSQWTVARLGRGDHPQGAQEGNWQRFQALAAKLGNEGWQNYFHESVLWPSRDFNHDLAERLFMAAFCRCPSIQQDSVLAWRLSLSADLLRPDCELFGKPIHPRARVQFWESGGWPNLTQPLDQGPWILQHLSSDSTIEILKWRYLLPLGSIITTGTMFRLERGLNALNRGFVLAR